MFDHVTIRVSDREASERFYRTVLGALGIEPTHSTEHFVEWRDFGLAAANDEKPVTRRVHLGFVAPSRERVDAFWRAGTEAGYESDGEPGPRPQYTPQYYGAFLLDPDGNSAEAVHNEYLRSDGGIVDHVSIRVADLGASQRFYETIAPHAGLKGQAGLTGLAHFGGANGSLFIHPGEPTVNVHLAFPGDNAAVDAFHRAATEAGYEDNGAPGERPIYHPGYYGAFVLDPDGNNVEVVSHNRG